MGWCWGGLGMLAWCGLPVFFRCLSLAGFCIVGWIPLQAYVLGPITFFIQRCTVQSVVSLFGVCHQNLGEVVIEEEKLEGTGESWKL